MDDRKILKLGSRQQPIVAKGVTSGTQKYIPPSAAKDVISHEATDLSIAAQRKREKATRRKQLAYFMAKASGGSQAQFEKVINNEDWDDLDVQEMLLEDRFSRYREVPIIGADEVVKAQVTQTNKNATVRKLEQIQKKKEFFEKETGTISSKYEENSNTLTAETVVAGKVKAIGLENELASVLNKYDSYLSMSHQDRQQSFSKEELSIFTSISTTGLTPSKLTGKKSILDFGDKGGSFDEEKDSLDSLSPIDYDYAADLKTPQSSLAAIFGAYRESLSGATYDVLPINKHEVDNNLLANEFELKAPAKYPSYMQPARGMKGSTVQAQQSEALSLPDNANVQEYFDNLAEQYIDPQKLEYMSPAEKSKAIRLISMQISKMLPSRLKAVSMLNATSIQSNDDKFQELVSLHGIDAAVKMAGEGKGGFVPPTAAYTAYPSPHELVASINSSKLREFADGVVKRGMTKKGRWTDDPEQMDTMSTLLTYGTHNLNYNEFDSKDDEYQRATVKRAALTELPKQLGKVYGISDTTVSRRDWGGGLHLNYDALEQTLDDQLSEDALDTGKYQLDRELEHRPTQLDRYARDELARTVDVFFQPAGDLSADYQDNNLSQVDEYLKLVTHDVDLQDDDGSQPAPSGASNPIGEGGSEGEGSGRSYEAPTGLEAFSREGPTGVDDSFATSAPSVDMQATEGVRQGAEANQRASYGNGLGESQSTQDATHGSRLGLSVATRAAAQTPYAQVQIAMPPSQVSARPSPSFPLLPSQYPVRAKPNFTSDPVSISTGVEDLSSRESRLASAKRTYLEQNPELSVNDAEQGTQEWLDDRKKVVTASDATRVISSDRARNTYVGEKAMENWGMTNTQPFPSEDIERGHRLETKIRQEYEKQTGTEILELGLLQSKGFPGGASLDGIVTQDGKPTKRGVEFKAPREFRDFAKYHDQTQMQMAVGGLDSVDIVQGVEVDGKLRTHTQTIKKDLEWQKRNKHKIQQAQDSIERNASMTQEEFLAAQATMAADKSGKYGFLVSANKQDVEEAMGKKKSGGSGGKGGSGGGGSGKGIFDDPSDRSPSKKSSTDNNPPHKQGWLGQLTNSVKDAAYWIDDRSHELSSASNREIGKPLDYGVNPGQYLGNNIAQRSVGISDQDSRSNTLSGMQMKGAAELGNYSGMVSQMVHTQGIEDIGTKMSLADNPTERARRIIKSSHDRGLSPEATQAMLSGNGLEGYGTFANLSDSEQKRIADRASIKPRASLNAYATANSVINDGAELSSVNSGAANAANEAINADASGFAKRTVNSMMQVPDIPGTQATPGNNDAPNGGTGNSYSGKGPHPDRAVDVNVHVKLEGTVATAIVNAGGKTASTQAAYTQSSTR